MTGTLFRKDISSTVLVPGEGQSAIGTETARAVAMVVGLLRRGESLMMTQTGAVTTAQGDGQWLMVQSAGSTGAPKTIRRSPASWVASCDVTRRQFGIGPNAPYAVLGAITHSLTLYAVLEALHIGCDLSVLTGLKPRSQARALKQAGAQVLYATPTQLRLLTAATTEPVPGVRWIFCGGGTLDPQTRAQVSQMFPTATLHEFFGASETSFMTISDAETPSGSVGRAYPGVDLQVRDAQDRDTRDIGEIWVKSPYLFDGYVDGDSPDTRWKNGYLSIGEMGRLDDAGNLTILGRKSRMVTVSDQNVFPEAIEAQMRAVPGVGHCAAIAVRDARRGHVIIGVLEGQQDDALAARVRTHCRATLGAQKTPRRILFVDRMPLLTAGKPDLIALGHQLEQLA